MQLQEVIAELSECPVETLLFAERVEGRFRPESAAVALVLSEAELARPWHVVAAQRAPSMEYFMEASVVLEMLTEWRANGSIQLPDLPSLVERIIYYAEHDA
jgi:hypothetical protein